VKFCERQRTYGSLPQLKHNFVKIDQGILSLRANLYTTRNQYASPPEGNAIAAGPLCDFWNVFFTKLDAGEGVSSQYLQQKYFNHLSAVDIIRIVKLIISIALNEAMKIFLLFYNMSLC